MRVRLLACVVALVAVSACAGLAEDALAKQLQVVTARGNVFTVKTDIPGNGTTTAINGTQIINNIMVNNATANVGFGYLPQIVIREPSSPETILWGNSTYTNAASVGPYMRVGGVDYAGMVESTDRKISLQVPSLSGEYGLNGEDRLHGRNELDGHGSDWRDMGGWMELSGGISAGGPYTSVVRLQDHYIKNNLVNVTGYASENATVRIVSSPNDLARLSIDGDGFAPEVVPINSRINHTKVLVGTQYSGSSGRIDSDISADLLECRAGKYDGATRGHRCHNFAYPFHPAEVRTDFYTKDCGGAVELDRRVRVGSGYVNVAEDVYANYTRGTFLYHGTNAPDYQVASTSRMASLPGIECGPKIGGYHHVTKISQNQTVNRGGTYLFDSNGKAGGAREYGPFLEQVYGNLTLNSGDHDVHLEGTGLFEETLDARPVTYTPTTVTFTGTLSRSGGSSSFANLSLESPSGERMGLAGSLFLWDREPSRTVTRTMEFRDAMVNGVWTVHASASFCSVSQYHLGSWKITIDGDDFGGSGGTIRCATERTTAVSGIVDPPPVTLYDNDMYLVAVGMSSPDEVVMVRATDQAFGLPLVINGLPPYAPYRITDDGTLIKSGMADRHGTAEFRRDGDSAMTGPFVFEYWPDALTYEGRAHANGNGILFDPYNDEVIEFPWRQDDPMIYVSRAYVKMTVPVGDTHIDGARLADADGRYVDYAYLHGRYDAGDEVYVPVFPGAREIYLRINDEWVQSYIKDVQQNSQARVFGNIHATHVLQNTQATASATMFATQPGDAIALISVTATGSAAHYLSTDYGHYGSTAGAPSDRWRNADALCRSQYDSDPCIRSAAVQRLTCARWADYVSDNADNLSEFHAAVRGALGLSGSGGGVSVSVFHNGEPVKTVRDSGSEGRSSVSGVDGGFGHDVHDDGYCFVRERPGVLPQMSSGTPWESDHRVETEFVGATFARPVVVSGVEPGDQIDFVVNAGSSIDGLDSGGTVLGSIPDPLPHWEPGRVSSFSLADITIDSGYIVLYQ